MIEFPFKDTVLKLETPKGVFQPNTTTIQLAKLMNDLQGKTVLDLGCGSGPIAIMAALSGAEKVYAVDIMEEACEIASRNARHNGVEERIEIRCGDLFEPIQGIQFDLIINDVSGMADEVSRISPWYPEQIPTGGPDGTEPTVRMLREAPNYLKDDGYMYFPVLSLACSRVILNAAREAFGEKVYKVASKIIPFCKELQMNIELLFRLRDEGIITFTQKRSRYIWNLDIYKAGI
jgi:release factor glutamine methyltransferase